jgi:hypothetical protein
VVRLEDPPKPKLIEFSGQLFLNLPIMINPGRAAPMMKLKYMEDIFSDEMRRRLI